MRKFLVLAVLLAALAIPVVATSATLANGASQNCKGTGSLWHFVNNQTGGAEGGVLTVQFLIDGQTVTITNSNPKVLNSVLQWNVFTDGDATLVNAWSGTTGSGAGLANIPGRLVLSDFCKKGD